MVVLANYANWLYAGERKQLLRSAANPGGITTTHNYRPKDIDPQFRKDHQEILTLPRGNGYCLWKPYVILKSLNALNDGELLMYCDSDISFVAPVQPIVDLFEARDLFLMPFNNKTIEKHWTKRDTFKLMDCDRPELTDTQQCVAGFIFIKKRPESIAFVTEWLSYMTDPRISTEMENQCGAPNHEGFREHRHDQSVFSLLVKKWGLEVFRSPDEWGYKVRDEYTNSPYGQILRHTEFTRHPITRRIIRKWYRLVQRID